MRSRVTIVALVLSVVVLLMQVMEANALFPLAFVVPLVALVVATQEA